ncbi:hypothetical protein [Sharpea azabuensis]|uniref:hypothetical protein n=1 Tax=Sharpea azabuensis TaxID=322505 RepID=UPI001568231A|nr:hypothetical protein [Sharpea azabuensis]
MAVTKPNIKKMLRLYMIEADINNFSELSRETGIDYQRLNKRIADPHSFTVFELISLDDVLHFDDEDLLKLIRG